MEQTKITPQIVITAAQTLQTQQLIQQTITIQIKINKIIRILPKILQCH